MKQLRKRNNYTLSIEAQEIIDKVKNKSRFVSEAIKQKNNTDNFARFLSGEVGKGYVKLLDNCEHEMVPCDSMGRIVISGEPFRGNAFAICRKCGFRP